MSVKILIIEDDQTISFALKRFLEEIGHQVTRCFSLADAYEIHPGHQDFIILDLNLPDGLGFEYLAYIREEGFRIPVLLLTVRDQEEDIVRGLEMGADDYLTKPFSLPVLKARIETILRRSSEGFNSSTITCGAIQLDLASQTAFLDGEVLDLSAKEYGLLELFIKNQGLTLTRDRILDLLWGYELGEVYDNTLSVTIKRLRDKIKPCHIYIKTIRGIGYRFSEDEG